MESVILLLILAAVLEICHQWKNFKLPILPWVSFFMVMAGLLWAVKIGVSLDVILIVLIIWFSIKLLPFWSRGHEL